jgi:hypothetical protein
MPPLELKSIKSLELTKNKSLGVTKTKSLALTKAKSLGLTKTKPLALTKTKSLGLTKTKSLVLTKAKSLALTKAKSLGLTKMKPLEQTKAKSLELSPTPLELTSIKSLELTKAKSLELTSTNITVENGNAVSRIMTLTSELLGMVCARLPPERFILVRHKRFAHSEWNAFPYDLHALACTCRGMRDFIKSWLSTNRAWIDRERLEANPFYVKSPSHGPFNPQHTTFVIRLLTDPSGAPPGARSIAVTMDLPFLKEGVHRREIRSLLLDVEHSDLLFAVDDVVEGNELSTWCSGPLYSLREFRNLERLELRVGNVLDDVNRTRVGNAVMKYKRNLTSVRKMFPNGRKPRIPVITLSQALRGVDGNLLEIGYRRVGEDRCVIEAGLGPRE